MGAHSDIGPSSSHIWLHCSLAVALLRELRIYDPDILPSEDEDYQAEGTALHDAVARLLRDGGDAWEVVGEKIGEIEITDAHADAIQLSLDTCRPLMVPHGKIYIEQRLSAPELHPDAFGTLDFGVVADSLLTIVDHKFGRGVLVEVERNPQLMYYAYMLLRSYDGVRRVVIRVVQPMAPHPDGYVRRWETTADEIHEWVQDTLAPAMHKAMRGEGEYCAGDHCRFCPAKLVCPLLTSLFEAAATHDPLRVVSVADEVLAQSWLLSKAVKKYITALEAEMYKRLMAGKRVAGVKLVPKRANRVWSIGGKEAVEKALGDLAYTREFKSPAEVEKIDKKLVAQWAHTPENGLTVAPESDPKPGVRLDRGSEVFAAAIKGAMHVDEE